VPVAKSDPRRATVVGIIGVVVGSVMILLVLFAGNLGGGDKVKTSSATFDVGPATDRSEAIARDKTPLLFPDTATGSHPIVVQHVGADPNKGWLAFDATPGNCAITWHVESENFTDCNGKQIPADGGDLHHYPTEVTNGHVIVDLSVDATTTTTAN
jgi:hypothetical protein